jgi:hypothetical protein
VMDPVERDITQMNDQVGVGGGNVAHHRRPVGESIWRAG